MKLKVFLMFFMANIYIANAADIYVATDGNDNNTGGINDPVETVQKAEALANSGDTVYIRGGVYMMREDQIHRYNDIWAYVTELTKNNINYFAYANEKPVFNYSNIKPAGKRVFAFYLRCDNVHIKGIDVTGVQVTITNANTQSECFEIYGGNNNTIENVNMYDNMAIGVYILRGQNNLILNCDAYRNYDPVSQAGGGVNGGNVDGFGLHVRNGDVGNTFRGCRAWLNSDDGFDTINSGESAIIENCWAFYNGYSTNTNNLDNLVSRGDGNGFKVGGYGKGGTGFYTILERYAPIPRNIVKFSLAVGNKQSGFYANHHLEGNFWYNNSAYANKRNYNMLNCEALKSDKFDKNVPGWNHVLQNNLGFGAKESGLTNVDTTRSTLENNYFDTNLTFENSNPVDLDISVTNNDFISLDVNLLMSPRQADGSLPDTDFMKLKSNSDLINAGKDIDFPFNGTAPDLGYSEYTEVLSTTDYTKEVITNFSNYPNPFVSETKIQFNLKQSSNIKLSLYNILGVKVLAFSEKKFNSGENTIVLKRSQLKSGRYFLVLQDNVNSIISKVIIVK